jgi:GlcNAc-P-P-Und epimerase
MIGVIGGSGFIGTALVRALRAGGHSVRIIDKARSAAFPDLCVEADVRDREGLGAACGGCDTLYNLAAEHRDDVEPRSLYHAVNVAGAEHTCAVAEQHGIERILFTSTVAVYGLTDEEVDEGAPLRPFNDYGRTKLAAERVFEAWAAAAPQRGLTIVRPTVVFGPDNRGNVYTLLAQIARGRNFVIGGGHNRKSMAYVENVADFLVYALGFGPGVQLYNYIDKPDIDMNELVAVARTTLGKGGARPWRIPYGLGVGFGQACDLAAKLTGLRLPISAVRVRKYGATTQFAAARVAASGFVPRHDLRDSLIATIWHEFGATAGPADAYRRASQA